METGHAITPDGVRIAYQSAQSAQEPGGAAPHEPPPPLLLLAGQANNHHWWDPIRADFHPAHRTITMDYRGTGESDKPDEPYTTRGFADDAIAVLDHLNIDRADVYGTSMGGRVAQWLAAEHPDRIRRLILGCTSPGGPHATERDKATRSALANPDTTAARRTLTELMYTPAWLATHPGPYTTLGDPTMPAYARGRHLTASSRHDAWDALPRITAPTLVLHGSDDTFNPTANAALLTARIPNATMHLIQGARHAYFEEFRHVAGPIALEFLRG